MTFSSPRSVLIATPLAVGRRGDAQFLLDLGREPVVVKGPKKTAAMPFGFLLPLLEQELLVLTHYTSPLTKVRHQEWDTWQWISGRSRSLCHTARANDRNPPGLPDNWRSKMGIVRDSESLSLSVESLLLIDQ